MCLGFNDFDMMSWLRHQIRVIEAWRDDVAMRPELDMEMIIRLEQHYQWLTSEVSSLEARQEQSSSRAA